MWKTEQNAINFLKSNCTKDAKQAINIPKTDRKTNKN